MPSVYVPGSWRMVGKKGSERDPGDFFDGVCWMEEDLDPISLPFLAKV